MNPDKSWSRLQETFSSTHRTPVVKRLPAGCSSSSKARSAQKSSRKSTPSNSTSKTKLRSQIVLQPIPRSNRRLLQSTSPALSSSVSDHFQLRSPSVIQLSTCNSMSSRSQSSPCDTTSLPFASNRSPPNKENADTDDEIHPINYDPDDDNAFLSDSTSFCRPSASKRPLITHNTTVAPFRRRINFENVIVPETQHNHLQSAFASCLEPIVDIVEDSTDAEIPETQSEVPETQTPDDDDDEIPASYRVDNTQSSRSFARVKLSVSQRSYRVDECNTSDLATCIDDDTTSESTIAAPQSADDTPASRHISCESSASSASEQRIVPMHCDDSPRRPRRTIAGGLMQQLDRAVDRMKSRMAFWQHERRMGLIEPGVVVEIERLLPDASTLGGGLWVRVREADVAESDSRAMLLLLDGDLKLCSRLCSGTRLEVDFRTCRTIRLMSASDVDVYTNVHFVREVLRNSK